MKSMQHMDSAVHKGDKYFTNDGPGDRAVRWMIEPLFAEETTDTLWNIHICPSTTEAPPK